ncbi:MAG: SDR family NAD(P)-dependent oxidoreductase [Holophagaceae bacterium]|nr:SDR family NAD(P)-dependent oxidoreductase [Holophagaceae bacterium]
MNLHGVIHGLQAFVPRMLAGGEEGRIVNTASAAGLLSPPGFAAYSVSKHAVVALSEVLHHDLALRESRLKVSVLCPAWVRTRIAQSDRHRQAPEGEAPSAPDGVSEGIAEAVRRRRKRASNPRPWRMRSSRPMPRTASTSSPTPPRRLASGDGWRTSWRIGLRPCWTSRPEDREGASRCPRPSRTASKSAGATWTSTATCATPPT